MLSFPHASVTWLTHSMAVVLAGPRVPRRQTGVEGSPGVLTVPWNVVALRQVSPIFRPLPETPKARARDPEVDWLDVAMHYRPVP